MDHVIQDDNRLIEKYDLTLHRKDVHIPEDYGSLWVDIVSCAAQEHENSQWHVAHESLHQAIPQQIR
jgi:hypothetical protein